MNANKIERLVWKHNAKQIIVVIAMVIGSLIFWPLSYWIFYYLFSLLLGLIGVENARTIGGYMAWGGVALLVFEGYRYYRAGCDLQDSSRAAYAMNNSQSVGSGRAASLAMFGVSNPSGLGHIFSQVLFCAPTMTITALNALKSHIRTPPDSFEQAAEVYNYLASNRHWVPAKDFGKCMAGVMLLDRLELIWTESKEGTTLLRIPPGEG